MLIVSNYRAHEMMAINMRDSKRVMSAKIGHMVDPRTLWAFPMYEDGEQHTRILNMERQISSLPSEMVTELTDPGTLIAVRKTPESRVWMRGRLDQLSMYGKQLVATVFLLDYGEVIESVRVETCMKHMPAGIVQEPPLAFKVVLAGLTPVSMDLDFMVGQSVMEVTPQRGWDQAAWREVKQQVEKVDGVAELRDWVVDQCGRYHGQVFLVGEGGEDEVHLNQLLVEKQFAVESQWQMENDMDEEADDWEINKEFKVLDIRSKDLESWEVLDDRFVTGNGGGAVEQHDDGPFGVSEAIDPSFESSAFDNLGNLKSCGRGKSRDCGVGSSRQGVVGDRVGDREKKAKEFLERLRGKKKIVESQIKTIIEDVDADEEFWSAVRGGKPGTVSDDSVSHLLPGGVFIGRHHEKVLAHIQAENKLDQKKKFEQFVSSNRENNK